MNAIRRLVRALRLPPIRGATAPSPAQLFVLEALAPEPAASISALAQRTLTDPSSVSVVVARLVEQGLVHRSVSPVDARRMELGLTDAGRELLGAMPPTPQARAMDALQRLSPEARRGLLEGLLVLVEAMGASDEPASMFFEEHEHHGPSKRKSSTKRGAP